MLLKEKFIKYLFLNKIPFKHRDNVVLLKVKGSGKDKYEVFVMFNEEMITIGMSNALSYDEDKKNNVYRIINELNSIEDTYLKFRTSENLIFIETNTPIFGSSIKFRELERFILDFVLESEVYLEDIYKVI